MLKSAKELSKKVTYDQKFLDKVYRDIERNAKDGHLKVYTHGYCCSKSTKEQLKKELLVADYKISVGYNTHNAEYLSIDWQ